MKRTIKLAVAAAVALTSTAAFATNGDNLIAVGAKARGMGGVGIGMSHGAESALSNPANITTVKGTEVSFGGTVFMPDVYTDTGMGQGSVKSTADLSVIPEIAVAQNIGSGISWGIGMYGTAGMGTDYRNGTTGYNNFNMVTNLQLMQFAIPVAYKTGAISVGIAPVIQYGSLDINFNSDSDNNSSNGFQAQNNGTGVGQDLGLGYTLGLTYSDNGLTLGASYKSAINMTYDKVITTAASVFGLTSITNDLEQPAEIGVGVSYKMGASTLAFDYKRVKWSDAKGYNDFGWDDQNVYAIGYEYAEGSYALRAGFNYAKSPIKSADGSTQSGAALNVLNLLGFPAIVEKHYTVGGTYAFNKTTALDLAYVYVPESTETFSAAGIGMGNVTTKHTQDAVTAQVNFNF